MTLAILLSEKPIQHKEVLFTSTITPALVSCGGKVAYRYLNTSSASFFDWHSSHPDHIPPNQHPSFATQTMHLSSRQQDAARSAKALKCAYATLSPS